jgi:hypothetical protein
VGVGGLRVLGARRQLDLDCGDYLLKAATRGVHTAERLGILRGRLQRGRELPQDCADPVQRGELGLSLLAGEASLVATLGAGRAFLGTLRPLVGEVCVPEREARE